MTEELKEENVAEIVEEKKCKCECCKNLKKFLVLTGAVFVGTTLAILVSASLLRPACPPPMPQGPQPRMERPMDMQNFDGPQRIKHHGDFKGGRHQQRPDMNAPRGDFQPGPRPEKAAK